MIAGNKKLTTRVSGTGVQCYTSTQVLLVAAALTSWKIIDILWGGRTGENGVASDRYKYITKLRVEAGGAFSCTGCLHTVCAGARRAGSLRQTVPLNAGYACKHGRCI